MPRHEPPNSQFDRLKRQLQDSILNDYPNPKRKGCPGDGVLKALAIRPLDDSLEGNPHWNHITHCSECYREFLRLRAERRRKAKTRLAMIGLAASAAAVLIAAGALLVIRESTRPKHSQSAGLVFRRRIVDLAGRAMTRSEGVNEETKPIVLEPEPEELIIRLPFASKEGAYEVRIERTAGHPLLSATGQASIENGTTALTAKMDLSKIEPGSYFICVRRVPWDWTCYPALIR
jgi:hypothetical protein